MGDGSEGSQFSPTLVPTYQKVLRPLFHTLVYTSVGTPVHIPVRTDALTWLPGGSTMQYTYTLFGMATRGVLFTVWDGYSRRPVYCQASTGERAYSACMCACMHARVCECMRWVHYMSAVYLCTVHACGVVCALCTVHFALCMAVNEVASNDDGDDGQ